MFTTRCHPPAPQAPSAGSPFTEMSTAGRSETRMSGTRFESPVTFRDESTETPCTMVVSIDSSPMPLRSVASSPLAASPEPSGMSHEATTKSLSSTNPGSAACAMTAVISTVPSTGAAPPRTACTDARIDTVLPLMAV